MRKQQILYFNYNYNTTAPVLPLKDYIGDQNLYGNEG